MKNKKLIGIIVIAIVLIALLTNRKNDSEPQNNDNSAVTAGITVTAVPTDEDVTEAQEKITSITSPTPEPSTDEEISANTFEYDGKTYEIVEIAGGDTSGERLPNVAVDIGYGNREYWALTNEYGQLVYVIADEIVLQDDDNEPVTSDGRYYGEEAFVPGTELLDYDQGHVIADSLGGVSNAYNITPQDSTLNRYGDQAYMEKVIRDAGGCTDYFATIIYPDTDTQIPERYKFEYTLNGERIVDKFENVNPDEVNSTLSDASNSETEQSENTNNNSDEDLSRVDTNGNGKVTIAEAKAAGYSMPIYSDHWLYKYMDDRDGDGMVGE